MLKYKEKRQCVHFTGIFLISEGTLGDQNFELIDL